jgi:hypothetical protein
MTLRKMIIVILAIGLFKIDSFSNDFNYSYWLNSHSKAVEKFKNHFLNEIANQNFKNFHESELQISIVPYLRIIDTTKYYKPKNMREFYNSIGIDTTINYSASLKFNNIYCSLLVLDGKLVYIGRSDEDEYYKGLKKYFDSHDYRSFVNVMNITQGSISEHYYIDTTDLRIPSIVFKSSIDTNKPIGLYEYLRH